MLIKVAIALSSSISRPRHQKETWVGTGSEHRRCRSQIHSALLLMAMAALLSYCGWIVAEWDGIVWSLVAGAATLILVRRMPPGLVLRAIGARAVSRSDGPAL